MPSQIKMNIQVVEMSLRIVRKFQMRGLTFPIGPRFQFELSGSMEEQIRKKMKIEGYSAVASRLK